MTKRCASLGLVPWALGLAALAAPAAAGQSPQPAALELARMYAAGQREAALERLAGWDKDDFRRDWIALRELQAALRGPLPAAELRAAVVLHSDRAALDWQQLSPAAREAACGASLHREHARSLAELLIAQADRTTESQRTQEFVRTWVTAMALDSHRYACLDQVAFWTAQGSRWFPKDAVLLLIQATAAETAARLRPQPAFGRPNMFKQGGRLTERAEWRQQLVGAARDLEAALVLDPELDEARVRLGRIQWQLGKPREAQATLEALLARARAPVDRYLGHLFLGRVLEAAGERLAALEHYRSALALDPSAQAAAMAVGHALLQEGAVDESRAVLRHALKRAPREEPRDAYLSYHFGRAAQAEPLLAGLRAELAQ